MSVDPIALARELIDIQSVSGEEHAVTDFLDRKLPSMGLNVRRQDVENGRTNLLATAGGAPRVLLCSHTDTVPPFFPSREDDDYVYGRGACDTKGIIAAMLTAGEKLVGQGVRDFGYLFVVAEETDSIGAKKANEELSDASMEYIIVGEPTESKFVRASKGALTVTVRFRGVAAHSAYPERGDSAVRKLARAVEAVYANEWGSDPLLGITTANVGVIRGGEKANIIPASAEMEMIFRTAGPHRLVLAELERLIAPFDADVVRWHGNDPTYMLAPAGEPSSIVAFNTDVPHLSRMGKPILYGPGSILDAHTAEEKIRKSDIVAAAEKYSELVNSLLKGSIEFLDGKTH